MEALLDFWVMCNRNPSSRSAIAKKESPAFSPSFLPLDSEVDIFSVDFLPTKSNCVLFKFSNNDLTFYASYVG